MRKIFVLLLTIAICCTALAFVGCDNQNDTNDNNNNTSDLVALNELPQYMANINGATAFGVLPKKRTISRSQEQNKNYFVMTTEEYDSNKPSIDENGLLKVTFSKIVTENVTTEINGVKFAVAKDSKLSFSSIDNFTYSIYSGEECLYESVYDNDDNDINSRKGYITLDNMIDNNRYEIRYTGIGKEEKITQDEIDGEIDKMYVMDNYTFISFVPTGLSNRQSDINSHYDKQGYWSDSQRQSFVIDNVSGYIYLIDNMAIDQIGEGLLKINGKIYDVAINDNDELQFTQVVKNETLNVYYFFKDKYGNKHIQNDYLDAYDKANNTVYYTKTNYLPSREGIAIHIDYTGNFSYYQMPTAYSIIEKVGENFTFSPIKENESYRIEYSPINDNSTYGESRVIVSHIEQGYLYMFSTLGGAFTYYNRINVTSKEVEYKQYGSTDWGHWKNNCLKSLPIDSNTVLFWSDWSGTGKVYSTNVWKQEDFYWWDADKQQTILIEDGLTILLENCISTNEDTSDYYNQDWTFDLDKLRFRQTTFDGTIYYKVVVSEQGLPQIVNTETYVAPNQEDLVLQPINK